MSITIHPAALAAVTEAGIEFLNTLLVAECERAMRQRDEFLKTGVSTSAHGGAFDTCFGHILRANLITARVPRVALPLAELSLIVGQAQINYNRGTYRSFEIALARGIEAAHGIKEPT